MDGFTVGHIKAEEISAAVAVIAIHSDEDGELAGRYFEKFFPDETTWTGSGRTSFVARDQAGTVIGIASIGPDKYVTPEILWIDWFYVGREWHGKGVGQVLWDRLLAQAKQESIRKIYLDTSDSGFYNRAIAFYEKMGFTEEGRLKNYDCPGEDQLIFAFDVAASGSEGL